MILLKIICNQNILNFSWLKPRGSLRAMIGNNKCLLPSFFFGFDWNSHRNQELQNQGLWKIWEKPPEMICVSEVVLKNFKKLFENIL